MKQLFTLFLISLSFVSFAQDRTQIVVNTRDNARLQFNGNPVKTKATVYSFRSVSESNKDFEIILIIQMFESVAGAYGNLITSTISADQTLSPEEREDLLTRYADKVVTYNTYGKYTDASGNSVLSTAPGAIPEMQYWQTFKLNQIAGMGTAATQGALDANYLTIRAIVTRLNQRKNF